MMKRNLPRLSATAIVAFFSMIIIIALGCSHSGQAQNIPEFDQNHAFDLLKEQVDFGPRYPGVDAHEKTAQFILDQLKPYADGTSVQSFTKTIDGKKIKLQNVIAYFRPKAKKWVLLAAHWDTRPIADQEVNLDLQKKPIPGANDGASGVAVLLELARVFSKQTPDIGVMMVFFDGEDYATLPPSQSTMFLGSEYFAANLDKSAVVSGKNIKFDYGILLDMIGDKDLNIYQEVNSARVAPSVVKKIWATAKSLGYEEQFIPESGYSISDDHLPLIEAGIKCIDIIDFNYGPWHTLDDTTDKCSAKSLKVVGDVVANVIYQEKVK